MYAKFFAFIIFICFSLNTQAQYKQYRTKSRKTEGLADYIRPLNHKGWYIAPGITLTPKLNFFKYEPETQVQNDSGTYSALDLNQQSKIGAYLEVGRYKLLSSKKLISYIDYGLAYKWLRGGQTYDLEYNPVNPLLGNDTTSFTQGFNLHNITAHFNANNVIGINKNFFIQNTLGANIDYTFIRKVKTDDGTPFASTYQEQPPRFGAQIHYKFGLGFRFSELIYLIPSVEVPVLNAWKFEGGRSTLGFFNSRYRPIIISLRIAWLTKPSCPKVYNEDGIESGPNGKAW